MGNNFGRTCCFRFKIQNASLEKNVTAFKQKFYCFTAALLLCSKAAVKQ